MKTTKKPPDARHVVVPTQSGDVRFTKRQFEALRVLGENPSWTNAMIGKRMGGEKTPLSPHCVGNYLSEVYDLVGLKETKEDRRALAVRWYREYGRQSVDGPPPEPPPSEPLVLEEKPPNTPEPTRYFRYDPWCRPFFPDHRYHPIEKSRSIEYLLLLILATTLLAYTGLR